MANSEKKRRLLIDMHAHGCSQWLDMIANEIGLTIEQADEGAVFNDVPADPRDVRGAIKATEQVLMDAFNRIREIHRPVQDGLLADRREWNESRRKRGPRSSL